MKLRLAANFGTARSSFSGSAADRYSSAASRSTQYHPGATVDARGAAPLGSLPISDWEAVRLYLRQRLGELR
jgi:hypothetical protein